MILILVFVFAFLDINTPRVSSIYGFFYSLIQLFDLFSQLDIDFLQFINLDAAFKFQFLLFIISSVHNFTCFWDRVCFLYSLYGQLTLTRSTCKVVSKNSNL